MRLNGYFWRSWPRCESFYTSIKRVHSTTTGSHTRHPTGISLGSLSLNLSLPTTSTGSLSTTSAATSSLETILSLLLPKLSSLALSIPTLNALTTHLIPQNKNENLESGSLQLSDETMLLINMIGVGEGVLGDWGVRNLQGLTKLISVGKLEYRFDYSEFELETNLGIILLTEGKSFVPVCSLS